MHRPVPILLLTCAIGAVAPATTYSRETTADLVRRAERVCCVRCLSVEARKAPRNGIVYTHVRLRLLEDLKGSADSIIELRIAGGRAGGVETIVAGMPRFRRGEETVLILGQRNRSGYRVVLQANRGVLPLVRDKQGRRRVNASVTGIKELKGARSVSLDLFRRSIKRVVREHERKERVR